MSRHTPGPWHFEVAVNSLYLVRDEDGREICAVMPEHAPLIAAAPELLEALRSARAVLDTAMHQPVNEIGRQVLARRIASADAAIAKATGEGA